jgi:hypothetical protein
MRVGCSCPFCVTAPAHSLVCWDLTHCGVSPSGGFWSVFTSHVAGGKRELLPLTFCHAHVWIFVRFLFWSFHCMFSPFSSPGGGRVWPLVGYWSYTEYQEPTKCLVPDACLGVDVATAATSPSGVSGFFTNTQKCAIAYTGPRCSQCADGYYQLNGQRSHSTSMLQTASCAEFGPYLSYLFYSPFLLYTGRCYWCGSSVDQKRDIILTVIVGLSAMGFLSMLVAMLKALPLAEVMQVRAHRRCTDDLRGRNALRVRLKLSYFRHITSHISLCDSSLMHPCSCHCGRFLPSCKDSPWSAWTARKMFHTTSSSSLL